MYIVCDYAFPFLFYFVFFWDQVSYLDPRPASNSEIFLLQSHRCWDISCQAQLCLFICPSYTPVNWISGSYGNSTLSPWGAVNLWELLSRTVGMYYGSLHRWAFLFCTPTTDSESWMGCNVLFPLAWNVHLTEETWAPEGEWNTSGALSHLLVQCELLMVAASSDKAAMGWIGHGISGIPTVMFTGFCLGAPSESWGDSWVVEYLPAGMNHELDPRWNNKWINIPQIYKYRNEQALSGWARGIEHGRARRKLRRRATVKPGQVED